MNKNKLSTDFYFLFFRREILEMLGKKYVNMWILLGILILTFLAIGFANGSLSYLEKKMSDPFINWVSIEIPANKADSIYNFTRRLNDSSTKEKYNIGYLSGYFNYPLSVKSILKGGSQRVQGRTIDPFDPISEKIFNKKNLVKGACFQHSNELGIVVTEELLKDLGYSENANFLFMTYMDKNDSTSWLPLNIIAIVKNLPGLSKLAFTPYFYDQRVIHYDRNPFTPYNSRDLQFYFEIDDSKLTSFKTELEKFLSEEYKNIDPMVRLEIDSSTHCIGYRAMISFYPEPANASDLNIIFKNISQKFPETNITRLYAYKTNPKSDQNRYDFLSVYFRSLEKVGVFKEYLYNLYDIEIDMAQIKAKENYNFISKLTRTISSVLIIFSLISISIFVSNVLKKHLEKIKMNIGSFKAFGISTFSLKLIYLSIIFVFVGVSILISFLIAYFIGNSNILKSILEFSGQSLESEYSYFTLFNIWTYSTVFSLFLICYVVIVFVSKNIFSKSPGDLIYNRD